MKIPIDRQSEQAIYLQIRDRLKHLIEAGVLLPGQQLPSIRGLAETTQVNKLTVIEAYGMLEAEGLIQARQGVGYFVSAAAIAFPKMESTFAPAQSVVIPNSPCGSFCRFYTSHAEVQEQPGMVDFGFGVPHPPEDLSRIARRAMTEVGDTLFHYNLPQGQVNLRQQVAQQLIQLGLEASANDLIITTGSQQGMFLAIHYYVQPGDWVIVESPTYAGVLAVLETLGARVIGIPMTAEGMNLELLEQYLQSHRPKLIFTISTLHNPTGISTSQAHRQQLLALAEQYECPIIEDNAYEGLNFETIPSPIKAFDRGDWVTYLGTFSKTLMPGLRVGYIVTNRQNHKALLDRKLLYDLHSSTVSQAIVSEYLASGHYRRHLNRLRTSHLQSRNLMLQAMARYFPDEVTWTVPKGGLFLWVQLPDCISLPLLWQDAIAQNVLISDSSVFFPGQLGYPALRLSFQHLPEDIERGTIVIANSLKRQLQTAKPTKRKSRPGNSVSRVTA